MPLGSTKGHKIDREQFADLLTRYYRLRGWSDEGVLRPERIKEIEAITSACERKRNHH
jgi:aldehyde:ferredoxin oxidoreductase